MHFLNYDTVSLAERGEGFISGLWIILVEFVESSFCQLADSI